MPAKRQESIIKYGKLLAAKAESGLYNEDIEKLADVSRPTITAVMNGHHNVNLANIVRIAEALGQRVIVDFQPLEKGGDLNGKEESARADLQAEQGQHEDRNPGRS
jgi:transcriptional regulator with XRE-family HTH domain